MHEIPSARAPLLNPYFIADANAELCIYIPRGFFPTAPPHPKQRSSFTLALLSVSIIIFMPRPCRTLLGYRRVGTG